MALWHDLLTCRSGGEIPPAGVPRLVGERVSSEATERDKIQDCNERIDTHEAVVNVAEEGPEK